MKINKVTQKKGHCGPASVAMLFSFYGKVISQDDIVEAIGIQSIIEQSGSRIDQLSGAVKKLMPNYEMLVKYNAKIEDIDEIVNKLQIPVGFEWQGGFITENGTYFEEGHYSIITAIDFNKKEINIIDPDKNSFLLNGRIEISDFYNRWWEINQIPVKDMKFPNQFEEVKNDKLLFVISEMRNSLIFKELGFTYATLDLMRKYKT